MEVKAFKPLVFTLLVKARFLYAPQEISIFGRAYPHSIFTHTQLKVEK